MNGYYLKTEKITGRASESAWSQIHIFTPLDEERLSKRGTLGVVLALKRKTEGWGMAGKSKEVVMRFQEEYFKGNDLSTFEQLKKTLEVVAGEFGNETELEVTAIVLKEKGLFVGIWGEGKVLLQREGEVATVLEGKGQGVEMASGFVKKADKLLAMSGSLKRMVPEGTLRAVLESESLTTANEMLLMMVENQDENMQMGAILGEVWEEGEEVELVAPAVEEVRSERAENKIVLIGDWWARMKEAVSLYRQTTFATERPFKIKTLVWAGALLVLLVAGVVWGGKLRQTKTEDTGNQAVFEEVRAKEDEAMGLLSLNPLKARETLMQATDLLAQNETAMGNNTEFRQLKQEVADKLAEVTKEYQVSGVTIFDLELIKAGAGATAVTRSGEQLLIADQNKQNIYKVGLTDEKTAILMGGDLLGGIKNIVVADENHVYALTESGIVVVDKDQQKQKVAVKADNEWPETISLRSFGGNLYLLSKKQIWQYVNSGNVFGNKKAWIKSSEGIPGLEQARQMRIDGSVWVMTQDGTINKYVRGVGETFRMIGLEKPIAEAADFYTDEDQVKIYILDSGEGRVVVVGKDGKYEAQYRDEQMKLATQLLVSEKEGKMWLLGGNKIWEVGLK